MKRILFVITIIFFSVLLAGCKDEEKPIIEEYQPFNETIEKYFLALMEEDLYTMKQYLHEDVIKQNPSIENAKSSNQPKNPEKRLKMGDKYTIKGFDYFYKDYGEIYYYIEYYNYNRNGNDSLVFAVQKNNGEYKVFSAFGHGGIGGSHVKNFNNGDYFTPSNLKVIMNKYPEHTFIVKEYPGD